MLSAAARECFSLYIIAIKPLLFARVERRCFLLQELYSYDSNLVHRPKVLVITKMDSEQAEAKYNHLTQELVTLNERGKGVPIFLLMECISSFLKSVS